MSDTWTTSHGTRIGIYCGPAGPPLRTRYTIIHDGRSIDLDVWQAESLAQDLLGLVNGDLDPEDQ